MTPASETHNVSGYRVVRYGPNESVPNSKATLSLVGGNPPPLPGDFLLTHSSGIYG